MRPVVVPLALMLAAPALAQDEGGFDAHGFVLTAQDGDIRDHLAMQRPGPLTPGGWFVGGVAEWAHRPLVFVTPGGDGNEIEPALTDLLALNLTAGVSPHERFRITASMPLFLHSKSFGEGQGLAGGDLRLDVMAVLVDPDDADGLGVAVVPWIDLPTGASGKFLGRRTVGGGGVLAGTVEEETYTLSANLGLQADPGIEVGNLTGGASLVAAVGANHLLDDVSSIGLEARMQAPFSKNERAGTGTPSEAILSYRRTTESGAWFTGGLSAPLTSGAGAAVFRLFIGGGFGKTGPGVAKDRDMDGITDDLDACPTEPETKNGYIDEDGCPDQLSELVVDVLWRGEPVTGADLKVTGTDSEETVRLKDTETSWTNAVPPDTMWNIEGRKGECLRGDVKKLVKEGREVAQLDLKLVPSATASIHVHDSAGNPVPGARLAFESGQMECLPEPPALGSDGKTLVDIGPGRHKLIVAAPGYRVVEVPILASPGDELPVDVTLQPTKLKVEKNRIVILEKVNFELNKATIKADSFDLLNEVGEVIMRNPDAGRVEVQGHTDDQGSDSYNLDLSQRRAEAVRDYLIKRGVDKERLIAVGFGESKPIADNRTPAGRAENRRVEFILIDQDSQEIKEKVE